MRVYLALRLHNNLLLPQRELAEDAAAAAAAAKKDASALAIKPETGYLLKEKWIYFDLVRFRWGGWRESGFLKRFAVQRVPCHVFWGLLWNGFLQWGLKSLYLL